MKIAFIVSYFPEISPFISSQIAGLIQSGHDVRIFVLKEKLGVMIPTDVNQYHFDQLVTFFSIPENKLKRIANTISIFFRQSLKNKKLLLQSFNIFKFGGEALRLNTFYYRYVFLDKEFDIIHCHFGPNGLIGVMLKKMKVKGKLINTFHGYDISSFLKWRGNDVYNELFEEAAFVLPVSQFYHRKIAELGCPNEKIITHHVGVDLRKFVFREKAIRPGDTVKLLTIANLTKIKGLEYSIQAFSQLKKKHDGLKYCIAGDGPEKENLEQLVRDLNLTNSVMFVGKVNELQVINLYQESHLFVLTSITTEDSHKEGIPTVLMEAQACGLPVVSTNYSGIPEVVCDGKSGFLVPEKDVRAIVEKIEYLVYNPNQWARFGKIGRAKIENEFEINMLNRKLELIYLKAIEG